MVARAQEKQRSREQDNELLKNGERSVQDLRAENGAFTLPKATLRLARAKRLA